MFLPTVVCFISWYLFDLLLLHACIFSSLVLLDVCWLVVELAIFLNHQPESIKHNMRSDKLIRENQSPIEKYHEINHKNGRNSTIHIFGNFKLNKLTILQHCYH